MVVVRRDSLDVVDGGGGGNSTVCVWRSARSVVASIVHAGLGETGRSNARRDLARVALRAMAAV